MSTLLDLFTSADFYSSIIETAIGALFGFLLGMVAFSYQHRRQLAADQRKEKQVEIDALRRVRMAAIANIETLALNKLQFLTSLRPEAIRMKQAAERAFEMSGEDRERGVALITALSSSLRHFYISLPPVYVMQPPDFEEYSSIARDMPALSLFVHRAISATQTINGHNADRNARIAAQALENGQHEQMRPERVLYYASMLGAEGEALVENTEFALNFWRLVLDQVDSYLDAYPDEDGLPRYPLLPQFAAELPEAEMTPVLREHLVEFSRPQ